MGARLFRGSLGSNSWQSSATALSPELLHPGADRGKLHKVPSADLIRLNDKGQIEGLF